MRVELVPGIAVVSSPAGAETPGSRSEFANINDRRRDCARICLRLPGNVASENGEIKSSDCGQRR